MSRPLWTVALVACIVAIVALGIYTYRLPSEQSSPLPLVLAAPFVLLARLSWRQLRRSP